MALVDRAQKLFERVENDFTYHAPFGNQTLRYANIRKMALDMAKSLLGMCPDSRELSLALTHLDEVVYWANSSIARNEKDETPKV